MENQFISTNKQLPRDVFLYLLNVIVLGMVAVNVGVLLFQFVNVYVPDVLADRFRYPEEYKGAIRWAVATLVIVFPVFAWVTRFLNRDITANPEKKELKIRKWLLYLTLFVAGLIIIGDLVALVFNFLEGELTMRFVFKIFVILGIAGSVFYYYLNVLRDTKVGTIRVLSQAVVGVVALSVVAGLFVAGLPQSRRLVRLDEQRVNDLANIQNQTIEYWRAKNTLPASLRDLVGGITGDNVPTDPETGASYEYSILEPLKFSLCAVFTTDNKAQAMKDNQARPVAYEPYGTDNWGHGVGRACFERTIDPDFYRIPGKPLPL